MQCLTIAPDAVICNPIAMVDAFAKFHRLHVGVVDCRMWVISRRLTMCATCHGVHWHILHCCNRWNCCSSWGWGLLTLELRMLLVDLTRWQGQVAFSQERVCARWVKVGGARTDFRSASFLNSFKCCHTPHPDLKYILGTVSFSFSYFTPDFHQALDLCSCVMGYLHIFWWSLWLLNIASVNLVFITFMFSYCCLFCIRLCCSWSLFDFVPQESQ